MMDDLGRTDFFIDNGPNELPHVYADYAQTDGNNNLSATGGQMKTLFDDILMSDPLDTTSDTMQSNLENLESFTSIPWPSSNGSLDLELTTPADVSSDPNSASWLLSTQSDGEVITLTNLLDPFYGTYEDQKMDHYLSSAQTSDPSNNGAISSNMITTTTFMNDNSTSPTTSSENDLPHWQGSPEVFCADDSFLRNALQSGNQKTSPQIPTTVMAVEQKFQQPSVPGSADIVLRKFLSCPPLANGNTHVPVGIPTSNHSVVSSGSPTSSVQVLTTDHHHSLHLGVPDRTLGDGSYYEQKVDFIHADTVIPHAEELNMPRFNQEFNGMKNGIAISEKKIHSTTLSAKWTFSTNKDQRKIPRKRNKKQSTKPPTITGITNGASSLPSTLNCDNLGTLSPSGGSPKSSQSSASTNSTSSSTGHGTTGVTSRKERSLHYCDVCSKGFKDKYSVNVHIRTHTGEKPFICTICDKRFRQKAHLAKHYQTHNSKTNHPHGKGSKRAVVTVAAS